MREGREEKTNDNRKKREWQKRNKGENRWQIRGREEEKSVNDQLKKKKIEKIEKNRE